GRERLRRAGQPLFLAGRRAGDPRGPPGGGRRAGPAPPRPLPVDVRAQARLSRRAARASAGDPVCVLCLHAFGQGVGGDTTVTSTRERVLSGMRPTGKVHLGNHLGALANWVKLQDDYDCFFFVANWHALTTLGEDVREVPANTVEMVADWLAAGLDPERSTLFIQSLVPEHAELHLIFSML